MNGKKIILEPAEERFLHRQLSNKQNYLYFSIVGVVVGLGLLVYYVVAGLLDGVHFALIMVILIGARGNLKQHKDARLLEKFYGATRNRTGFSSAEQGQADVQVKPDKQSETVG